MNGVIVVEIVVILLLGKFCVLEFLNYWLGLVVCDGCLWWKVYFMLVVVMLVIIIELIEC